jgi:hypothetical protein
MSPQATSSIAITLLITQGRSMMSHGGHPTKISQVFLRLLKTFGIMIIHLEATTGAIIPISTLKLKNSITQAYGIPHIL